MGHIVTVCRKKARDQKSNPQERRETKNHQLEAEGGDEIDQEYSTYSLYYSTTRNPQQVSVTLNNTLTTMQVDTGATLSIMSEESYKPSGLQILNPLSFPTQPSSPPIQVRKFLFWVQLMLMFPTSNTTSYSFSLSLALVLLCLAVIGCSTSAWTGQGSTCCSPNLSYGSVTASRSHFTKTEGRISRL